MRIVVCAAAAIAAAVFTPVANAATQTASITEFAFTPGAGVLVAAAGVLAVVGRRRNEVEKTG